MRAICLYLHIHQPIRYREYSVFDISNSTNYFESDYNSRESNERIFKKVAEKSYHPMLDLLEQNLRLHPAFCFSLSITGTWLEQAEKWDSELISQIKRLVNTGRVEIVGETYYHSLAFFYNLEEFEQQVSMHEKKVFELFDVKPKIFRNTELAYNDSLATWADEQGYSGILAEGWDKILGWRSPNHLYRPYGCKNIKLLLKNYRLSDDIAFRFSNRGWKEWPLTVPKYLDWLKMDCIRGPLVNLFMDFETFGEHQWADTGIFDFMNNLISDWLSLYDNKFLTLSEACDILDVADEISVPDTITWADAERDLSAWLSNKMQISAMEQIYGLREDVLKTNDSTLIRDFRLLTTSDHPYSMCTKYWNDGDVHAYFSAYSSPYESFMYYQNILHDLRYRIRKIQKNK